jgi:hypothetical protein
MTTILSQDKLLLQYYHKTNYYYNTITRQTITTILSREKLLLQYYNEYCSNSLSCDSIVVIVCLVIVL